MEGFDADIRIIDFCVRSKKYNILKNNSLILCIFNFTPILNFKKNITSVLYTSRTRTLR